MGIHKYELSVDGDNLLLFVPGHISKRFKPEIWLELGHEIEVERVTCVFERILICQSQPVHTANGWTLVRNPQKALATIAMGHVYGPNNGIGRHLSTVLRTGAIYWAGTPLLGPIYAALAAKATSKELPLDPWERGLRAGSIGKETRITPDARVSFCRSFGITPNHQEYLEALVQHWKFSDVWETTYQCVAIGERLHPL
jgi:hypothetical protein